MFLVSLLAAIVPTVLYVTLLWWLDKYEKEPLGLFLAAFAYGCIPAVVIAIVFELIADIPLSGAGSFGETVSMGIVAPIVEESVKGFAVLLIYFIWRREFDGVLDGIIYGAVVGFGFAMTENFLYFLEGDAAVILLRTVPFGLNHGLFTAFTGAGLGFARLSKRRWLWLLLFPLFLVIAIAFHAAHNLFVSTASAPGCLGALSSNGIGVAVILVVAILAWGYERRWIREELKEEVEAGLLAEADFRALQVLSRRVGSRLWMWRNHGWQAFRLLGRFFNLATELAFRKHHLRAGTGHRVHPEEVHDLRRQVREVRGRLLQTMGAK